MRYKHTTQGFTLSELMVTISIFTLLITAFYRGTNNTFQQRTDIRSEITTIQTLFSNARNMAITSTGVTEDGSTTSIVPQYGYGVHVYINENSGVNETLFTLFADTEILAGDEFGFSSGDVIISEYSAFERGVKQGVNTEITLINSDGSLKTDGVVKKNGIHEFTILFSPLSAHSRILFDNDYEDTDYNGMNLNFFAANLIEESLEFNSVSRFFERTRICPATLANPQDCSTLSIL